MVCLFLWVLCVLFFFKLPLWLHLLLLISQQQLMAGTKFLSFLYRVSVCFFQASLFAGSQVRLLLSQLSWSSSCHPKAWLSSLPFLLLPVCYVFLWQCLTQTFQRCLWQCSWTSVSDGNEIVLPSVCFLKQLLEPAGQSVMWVQRISPGTIQSSYSWFAVKVQDWSEWDSPGICPGFGNTHCFHYWNDWWSNESSY